MVGHSASDVCRQKVAYYVGRMMQEYASDVLYYSMICMKAHAIEPVVANWCVSI